MSPVTPPVSVATSNERHTMAFRIPLLAALFLGAATAAQAQAPSPPPAPQPAAAPQPPANPAGTDKKAVAKKPPPKKAPAKADKKAETKPQVTYTTGPKEVRDKDGNVIPTDPAAYPIGSALPGKK